MEQSELQRAIEAILFAAGERIEVSRLAMALEADPKDIINSVFRALKEKGYNPISQFVGYLMSGDPTYITSYNNSRVLISSLERDEILEVLLRAYLNEN